MAGSQKLSDAERKEIRRLNEEEGISYAALAVRFDVSYPTISRICNPDKYEEQKKRNIESNRKNMKKILRQRKESQRVFSITLTRSKDSDMINHLDSKDNVSGYLKSLIRKDMDAAAPSQQRNNM